MTATAPLQPPPRRNSRRNSIPPELDPATYTVPQAADRAGVSARTMWRRIDARTVPGVLRIGRSVRISRKLFDAWIDGGK